MRLFNRGKEDQVATSPPAEADGEAAASAEKDVAEAEFQAVLDASVKEMSEKITRLASSLENVSEERASFEDKLQRMEDRMRKLSALTEMISAPYNPFVGDAPPEPESLVPTRQATKAAPAVVETEALPDSTSLLVEIVPDVEAAPEASPQPEPEPPAEPPAAVEPPAEAPRIEIKAPAPEPVRVLEARPPAPAADDDDLEVVSVADLYPSAPQATEVAPFEDACAGREASSVQLGRVTPTFENSMLLLNWANMLLKSSGSRDGVGELAEFYRSIGWIDDTVRDQLLAYANGIAFDGVHDPSAPDDWRGNVELHERSLLFVEKLRHSGRV